MSPVLGRPPRAPRSHPVKRGAQAPGWGKAPRRQEKPTGAPRATGPDEARRTTRGHEARQRGTLQATTKPQGQVPGSDGRRVPQTRGARTTRNERQHQDRCQATPVTVPTDVCAPGSEPSPYRLRNSRRPDGRACARRVPSTCRLRMAAVWMDGRAPLQRRPAHATHSTTHRASTPLNGSQLAHDTAQHTGRAHR